MLGPWRLRIDGGAPPPDGLRLDDRWVLVRDPLATVDVELLWNRGEGTTKSVGQAAVVSVVVDEAASRSTDDDDRSTIHVPHDTSFAMLLVVGQLAIERLEAARTALELKDRLARADFEAQRDITTGLFNRRGWLRWWERAIQDEAMVAKLWAIAILDLDDFKRINDTLGLAAGDAVLREVATRLARIVDAGAIVARWGGDEFVAALACDDEEAAREKLEALRASVADVESGIVGRRVTASLGWAPPESLGFGAPDTWLAQRLDLAERGLRAAKGAGRNRGEKSS